MDVKVDGDGRVRVDDAENLRALAVHSDLGGEALTAALGPLGSADGEHVWLDIAALRSAAQPSPTSEWLSDYDAMIAFARSRGWVSEDGAAVRAHIERSDQVSAT